MPFINKRSILGLLLTDTLDEQFATVFYRRGTVFRIRENNVKTDYICDSQSLMITLNYSVH